MYEWLGRKQYLFRIESNRNYAYIFLTVIRLKVM
jgi:hypothetical protein